MALCRNASVNTVDSEHILTRRDRLNTVFMSLICSPISRRSLANLHKDSIQRKIRRAEREGLRCEEGTGDTLLDDFYRLLEMTRRRHHLPPQPKKWFQNLVSCFGDALKIRVARNDGSRWQQC